MNNKTIRLRCYFIACIILNITSVIWVYLIGQTLFSLITAINDRILLGSASSHSWLPALILPILAMAFILATVVYSFHCRKNIKKLKLSSEIAGMYLNMQFICISAVRFITLHGIFEAFYLQSLLILKISENIISIQVICDIILIIIIIRLTKYRISALIKKEDKKKERRIVES